MTDEEYRSRILAIEAHYDARTIISDWRERMPPPYAVDCIEFLSTVVDADYYGVDRPLPENAWTRRELARWEKIWDAATRLSTR